MDTQEIKDNQIQDAAAESVSSSDNSGNGVPNNPPLGTPTPDMNEKELSEDAILDRILSDRAESSGESNALKTQDNNTEAVLTNEQDTLIRALRRDSVPQAIIDQVAKDPSMLEEWANKAMKRQENVDEYTNKMKELESQLNNPVDEPTSTNESVSEPTDAEESEVSNNLLDALTDEVGEEAVEPIREMNQRLTDLEAQLAEANARVAESEMRQAIEQAAVSVLSPWADMTEDKKQSVLSRMGELGKAKPGSFASIEEMMRQAAVEVLGEPKPKSRSATPSPPSRVGRLARPVDTESREDAALEVILGGGTADEAKQAAMRKL
tara:strand:+ start:2610 stop:3578 length:969 start_codon:yes stop_codon:yes gene_type:complete